MVLRSSLYALNSCYPHTHPNTPKLPAPHKRVSRADISHGVVDGDKNLCFSRNDDLIFHAFVSPSRLQYTPVCVSEGCKHNLSYKE
jgi:hypothetical protein